MIQRLSALLGIVGGIIDFVAGLALLQPTGMNSMGMRTSMSLLSSAVAGYFLLVLGAIVLLTGLFMLSMLMMRHRSAFGVLMLMYGVIMLILGFVMLGQVFFMMQGSTLSGSAMIIVGLAMLYSGSTMVRT